MNYRLGIMVLLASMLEGQERQGAVAVQEANQEQQYWQDLFAAIDQFKQKPEVSLPQDMQLFQTVLRNAAIVQVLSHALYVRELRTQAQFIHDLRKAMRVIASDVALKRELERLANMNLDPLWFVGRKMTVAQMSGVQGQSLVRTAALANILLKQAERVQQLVEDQKLELEQKKKSQALTALRELRLQNIARLSEILMPIMSECNALYNSVLANPLFMQNKVLNYYVKHLATSIKYVPDQVYLEEMETIGTVARALYPSPLYKKYG